MNPEEKIKEIATYKINSPPSEHWWTRSSRIMTCCCFTGFLTFLGLKGELVHQAWREKIALCMIIGVIMALVGFFTVGLQPAMCPSNQDGIPFFQGGRVSQVSGVRVRGLVYNLQDLNPLLVQRGFGNVSAWVDQDLTPAFQAASCKSQGSCVTNSIYGGTWPDSTKGCVPNSLLSNLPTTRLVFEWSFVPNDVVVYNNCALNVSSILNQPDLSPRLVDLIKQSGGRDVTLQVASDANQVNQMKCLMERATIGYIGSQSPSCTVYNALTTTALVTVLGLILIRFLMAFIFHWFIAPTLSKPTVARLGRPGTYLASRDYPKDTQSVFDQGWAKSAPLPSDLYTICLVTCYSEGESAIRHTLDSLSATDYPDERKLLFVICDGLIVGQGNSKSTPDIVVDMIEEDTSVGPALPRSYLAIADGTRQHNMARVHCGYYPYKSKRVPIVVVVKCGTDQEQSDKKPGNRGKRDSQVILMKFLNRVTFNDRMTALDYDLFYKIQQIACVTPDVYELVLMVDADTSVNTDSLGYMVQTMVNDENVMGLCGETRITNKRESWVTRIQVYEYFTSHNLGKAFESVFGRVTCLPGCFCMYRIKARKNSEWMVPLIINPDVVENYSEHVVDTLHLKNLLLLGEDRYLSTLMLKTFPKRKMVFVPQAICHTTVPHTFKMLLSQRRRWINSTIHNLLELMLVPNLCGIFCFSMKFVIALELLGTVSLPAAICFTFWLIIASLAGNVSVQPLVMLLFALFLPGLLVITTTNKPIYLMWMLYYLAALPVWNFVLPIYSFWHFDDFSWGDTRRVQGETKQTDHSNRDGEYEIGSVPMKTWQDWEFERRNPRPDQMDPQPSQMVNYPGIENSQTLGYSSSQTNSQTLGNPSSQHIGYPASETVVYPSSDRHAYLTSQSNSYPTTFESMERRNVQREINKSMEMDEKPRIIAVMPNVNVHQELLSWSKTHEVYPKAQSLSGSAPLSVSQQATGSTLGTDLSSHVGTNLSPPRRMSYPGNEKQHSWKLVQKQEQEPVIVPTGHADLNQVTTYFSDSDDEDTPEKNSFGKQSRNSVPLLNKPSNMSLLSQGSSVGQPYERPSQFLSTSKSGTFGKDKSSTINQFWRDLYLQQDSKNFDAPPTENSYLTADDHLFHNSVSFDSQVEPLNLSLSLPQDTSQQMGSNADLNLMEDQFKSSTLNLQERGQLDIRQSPIPVEDPNQSLSSVSSRSSVSGPRPPPDHWNTRVTEIEPLQAPSKTSTMKEAFKKAFFRASRKWSQEEEDPPRTSTDTAIYRPQEGPKGPRPMPK